MPRFVHALLLYMDPDQVESRMHSKDNIDCRLVG
jgi:hypothetical protein